MGLSKREEEHRDNALRTYLESGGRIKRLPDGPEARQLWTRKRQPVDWREAERRRISKVLQRRKAHLKAELAEVENQIERMQRADWRADRVDRLIEKKEKRRLNGRKRKKRRPH